MKFWLTVIIDVIKLYLICFGITLIGQILGGATFLIYYEIPADIIMQLLFDMSLASLGTPIPYILALLAIVGWYTASVCFLLRSRKKSPSIDFKLNDFLTMRFEHNKTVICVENKPFKICKYLLMNVPLSEVYDYDSIDEASDFYGKQLEYEITPVEVGLTPEEEFKGHCSNLQVWVEYSYDTCLLHRNLAFPLLKKLSSVGDPVAKESLAQEILERFKSGSTTVQLFLINGKYLRFLKENCIEDLFHHIVDKQVLSCLGGYFEHEQDLLSEIRVLNLLVEMDFINYQYLMVLANRYVKNNDTKMAILALRKILILYPNDEKALFFLAHLYMFEKKINKTKKILSRLKNSELNFVKYKNLRKLDWGMRVLLPFRMFDYYPDFFKELLEDSFEDW